MPACCDNLFFVLKVTFKSDDSCTVGFEASKARNESSAGSNSVAFMTKAEPV